MISAPTRTTSIAPITTWGITSPRDPACAAAEAYLRRGRGGGIDDSHGDAVANRVVITDVCDIEKPVRVDREILGIARVERVHRDRRRLATAVEMEDRYPIATVVDDVVSRRVSPANRCPR